MHELPPISGWPINTKVVPLPDLRNKQDKKKHPKKSKREK